MVASVQTMLRSTLASPPLAITFPAASRPGATPGRCTRATGGGATMRSLPCAIAERCSATKVQVNNAASRHQRTPHPPLTTWGACLVTDPNIEGSSMWSQVDRPSAKYDLGATLVRPVARASQSRPPPLGLLPIEGQGHEHAIAA